MKKILLVIAFGFTLIVNGQDYKPLLTDYNEWKLTSCYLGNCTTDIYYTDGEIEYNGNTHKVLDGYHYISRTFYLREDVNMRQVYLTIVLNSGTREYVLYDFSLEVGDVFEMKNPITPFPENGGPFELLSIDMVEMANGNMHKQFTFTPTEENTVSTENAVWIEGIGSLSILTAAGGHPDFTEAGHLSCSFSDGESVYANLQILSECMPRELSIGEEFKIKQPIVYANNDMLRMEQLETFNTVIIYSITGNKLKEIDIEDTQSIAIESGALSDGILILKFVPIKGNTPVYKKVILN